jgi:hypothetical protein
MGQISLCFDVDNGSLLNKTANITKKITEVISVDKNKVDHKLTAMKISTCLCFVHITQGKFQTWILPT